MALCASAPLIAMAAGAEMTSANLMHSGLVVEGRVIGALMLREIHTINGNSKLGYLWVLIQSVFSIAVFWALRAYMHAQAPHGMSMALFLALGFGIWAIFSDGITKTMSAVDGNRALLTFPQVTELDVMVSRVVVITATQIVTTALIISASVLFGEPFRPNDLMLALGVIFCTPLCALGLGMMLGAFAVFAPVINKLVPMVLRIGFFVSGVFFSIGSFRQDIAEILLYNPALQAVELMRVSLHDAYVVEGSSFPYLAGFTLVVLVLGALLERYVRSRRKEQ